MVATAAIPIKVFISYHPEDQKLREQLEIHIKPLEREGKIIPWHDGKIEPGMVKDKIRNDRLNTADLILLLTSPDFLYSDDNWEDEVLQALKRQNEGKARVIPIILRPSDWKQTPIKVLKPLPEDEKPVTKWENTDEAFENVAEGIRRVVETLTAEKERETVLEPPNNPQATPNFPGRNLETIKLPPIREKSSKRKLFQLIIPVFLLIVLLASSIFILFRITTDRNHAIFLANASATAEAMATASAINATPTPIRFTSVNATFYLNLKNSGSVDFNKSTQGVFTQSFPNIAFNPSPQQQHCNPPTTVDVKTLPFTDVVQNADGSCKTIQVKDGRGNLAGMGNLTSFEAKFVAVIDLPRAGRLITNISADDGWIFCMGNENLQGSRPTPDARNVMTHPLTSHVCPGLGLPEMADNNIGSSPTPFTITMNIAAAGRYTIEIDYIECCTPPLTLVVSSNFISKS